MTKNDTNTTELQNLMTIKHYVPWIYTILLVGTSVMLLTTSSYTFVLLGRANRKLHKAVFFKILRAPMSFFDNNLMGNILNRFSKDMSVVDEYIPFLVYQAMRVSKRFL